MDRKDERGEILRRAGPFMSIGSMFAAALALFTYGGHWADGKLGTTPWLTLTGALTGLVVGFYNFIVVVMRRPPE
ncbi:MAG TPA: AtpZ/AtpI family protein [Candidatus Polarisedimenticolia bacterium]|jgi:hypothetical protein